MTRERSEVKPERQSVSRTGKVVIAILVLATLGALGFSGYLYQQVQALKNDPKTLQNAQQTKAADVKAKVGKLISVPSDETPTLATVTDKTKLKDQPFFKDAENGDTILIFPQAKKAIIYRESENKLINVGPIAITSDAAAKAGTTPVTPEKK